MAAIKTFIANNDVNSALGAADEYVGENGIKHSIQFVIENLENCDVYGYYEVKDIVGNSTASVTMDTETLIEYAQGGASDWSSWLDFSSWTSYYPFSYTLEIRENTSDVVIDTLTIGLPNPHPQCTVSGSLSIEGVDVNSDN